jgi:hypothetical protein
MARKQELSESQIIEQNRKSLLKDVNRGVKEPIDRSVFKQTPEQKIAAFECKAEWKRLMRKCFPNPKVRRQYNNPIC